jgi:L-lactate dehydrogenase complex protein LldG
VSGTAREEILGRIRNALSDAPRDEDEPIARDYRQKHGSLTQAQTIELLAENLADYRALVHRCSAEELPATIASLLAEHGSKSVVIPDQLPAAWQRELSALTVILDTPDLTARQLDAVDSVISVCALAIAETGTIILDGGPGQGRRMLTLVPDHHICVIEVPDQVVASVPQALPRIPATRAQTWIAGPSATSDIELDRVEGVHGPRTLEVILVGAVAG